MPVITGPGVATTAGAGAKYSTHEASAAITAGASARYSTSGEGAAITAGAGAT